MRMPKIGVMSLFLLAVATCAIAAEPAGVRVKETYGATEGAAKRSAIWEQYTSTYVSSAQMTADGLVLTGETDATFGMVTGPYGAMIAMPMAFEFRMKWSFVPKGFAEMHYLCKPGMWMCGWRPGEIYDPANPASVLKVNTEEWQTYRLVARSPDDVKFFVVGREAEALTLKAGKDDAQSIKLLIYGKGTKATLTGTTLAGELP